MINIPEEAKFEVNELPIKTKLNKNQRITFMTIPDHEEELVKFSLLPNGKVPSEKYKSLEKSVKSLRYDNSNVGLKTGLFSGLTVIDVDLHKMTCKSDFKKNFEEEIDEHFGTFAVKTASGGRHYYFKYDESVKQSQCKKDNDNPLYVDVRNDGGYVVCPPSRINQNKYEVINEVPIIRIPPKLKKWCMRKLYNNSVKIKTAKGTKKSKNSNDLIVKPNTDFVVVMSREDFIHILYKLPIDCVKALDFRGDYYNWIQVLKASKFVGMKDEFIAWSQETKHNNYDGNVLLNLWNCEDTEVKNLGFILKKAKVHNIYTFKKLPENKFSNYIPLNRIKLDESNERLIKSGANYLIKSDPGTGKTTSFMNYVLTIKEPFISITSRVSLSKDQYSKFQQNNVVVEHYKNNFFEYGDNIIITPESSLKLLTYDLSEYIIFMDEFDSIIQHIISSETVKDDRKLIFKNIVKMLVTCKQFICADADISEISKTLLDKLNLKYDFYINSHQNYDGVKANVIYDEEMMFDIIKKCDEYILCIDGKDDAAKFAKKIGHDDIYIITADTKEDGKSLDEHKKLIINPKVLYGVDSVIKRPVFCHYSGQTIYPSQMVQQACRCRNIVELYMFFSDISSKCPEYETIDDVRADYKFLKNKYCEKVDNWNDLIYLDDSFTIMKNEGIITDQYIEEIYDELFIMTRYKNDCYNTNKFLHFINLLKIRGFVIVNNYETLKKADYKEINKDVKAKKEEEFRIDSQDVKRINKYLNIPENEIEHYKELFTSKISLSKHLNISSFFFSDEVDNLAKLSKQNDYDISKCKDIRIKFILLGKMLESIHLTKLNINAFVPMKIDVDDAKAMQDEYTKLFRVRKKDFEMKTDVEVYKEICNIYKQLFGITTFKLKKIKNESINIHSINMELYDYHKKIHNFRKPEEKKLIVKKNTNVLEKRIFVRRK